MPSLFRLFPLGLCLLISVPVAVPALANPFGACREARPQWYQCEKDEDCTIIVTPCGWPNEAVNRKSVEAAQRCNVEVGASLDCVAYDEKRDGKFRAACKTGQCIAVQIEASAKTPASMPVTPAPSAAPASKSAR